MTQEDKEILLKDLCARLPYGVHVLIHDTFEYSTMPYENVYPKSSGISSLIDSISLNERYNSKDKQFNRIIKEHKDFLEFKPYLRPMSSMTEEERKEWYATFESVYDLVPGGDPYNEDDYDDNWHEEPGIESFDWLNAHHFDYRGLIEKGLALEAPEDMYK